MSTDSYPTSTRASRKRTDVFISYSHKDKRWLEQLRTTLKPYVPPDGITVWDDTWIGTGAKWHGEIARALDSARVAVLLVSPHFLASDFIADHELPTIVEAAKRGELTIVWIAVSPSGYKKTALEPYQSANNPDRPLSTLPRPKRDEQFVRICEQIEQVIAAEDASETSAGAGSALPEPSIPPRQPEPQTVLRLIQDIRPDELIDFEDDRCTFDTMLDNSSGKQLMFVRAPSGHGKTSFLRMLRFRCGEQAIPSCWIDFRGQPYDNPHLSLALAICDQLRLSAYNLAQALQPLSMYRPAGDLMDPEAVARILAGVSFIHEDLRQRYVQERLKDALIADLNHFVEKNGHVVCLFDSFEDVSMEEEAWLMNALLQPIANGKLKGVIVVTAGYRWPTGDEAEWAEYAHLVRTLPSLKIEHMKMYAEKVNIKITDEEANRYWRDSGGGIPLHVAMIINNLRTSSEVKS